MNQERLHGLFQREFSKMVAVISKIFGLRHIEVAEDIVSETFLQAAESWDVKGIPQNPTAWLYTVAKQKMLYQLRRGKVFNEKVSPHIRLSADVTTEIDDSEFTIQKIKDSQLQMIFAVCNPAIASEAQIGLALRILCGFSIDEIADAFLSNKETINKRLLRAKDKLRSEDVKMEMPPERDLPSRLHSVLHILYLLFNEGYYSKTENNVLRKELCLEALRLALLLTEFEKTDKPKTRALIALMCFHASRFDARLDQDGMLVLYEDQDESLWDQGLIEKGSYFLNSSAAGDELTSYHLEAGIAFWHCQKADSQEKWEGILQHYDMLLEVNYSPMVALNRIFALSKVSGKEIAIAEATQLNLTDSHFYYLLLGHLNTDLDNDKAWHNFKHAHQLAKTAVERKMIEDKMSQL